MLKLKEKIKSILDDWDCKRNFTYGLGTYEGYGNDDYKKEYGNYFFPITRKMAFEIADADENLKSDYCRRTRGNISFLSFSRKRIDLILLEGRLYWQVQILDGDVSGIEYKGMGTTYTDGGFDRKDLKKLRCLIDVDTGAYYYYPVNWLGR